MLRSKPVVVLHVEPTEKGAAPIQLARSARLPGIQVGRGLASLLVVLFHTEVIFKAYLGSVSSAGLFGFGHAGVDFFFVLSGFILFWVHRGDVGDAGRVAAYARKRFRRVYPPYWVAFTLVLAGLLLSPGTGRPFDTQPGTILSNLALLPDPRGMTLTVAWTLSYEILFYILFGILIARPRVGMPLLALWVTGALLLHGHARFPWSFVFSVYPVHFALGASVAAAVARWRIPFPGPLGLIGAVVFIVLGLNEHTIAHPWIDWAYAAASAAVIAGLAGVDLAGTFRWPGLARVIGDASYSIYLVHYPVLSVVVKIFRRFGSWLPSSLLFLITVSLAVGGGVVFHRLIELRLITTRAARQRDNGAV